MSHTVNDDGWPRLMSAGRLALSVVLAAITLAAAPAARAVTVDLGTTEFGAMAVDDAGGHVFISLPALNRIDEFDDSGNLVGTIPNMYGVWGLAIDGSELYAAESNLGAVAAIDLTAPTLTARTIVSGLNGPGWLVVTGGRLWTTIGGPFGWPDLVSIDPSSGATTTTPTEYFDPYLAVSPGDPGALFIFEPGVSPGSVYRLDTCVSPPATAVQAIPPGVYGIEDLTVSPDGTRVVPAADAPYLFEELSAATLQPDGLTYPGHTYPVAVASSPSGLLATGMTSDYSPALAVFRYGKPAMLWRGNLSNIGSPNVVPHGLALTADGSQLFVVAAPQDPAADVQLNVFSTGLSKAVTATSRSGAPCPGSGSGGSGSGSGSGAGSGASSGTPGPPPSPAMGNVPTSNATTAPVRAATGVRTVIRRENRLIARVTAAVAAATHMRGRRSARRLLVTLTSLSRAVEAAAVDVSRAHAADGRDDRGRREWVSGARLMHKGLDELTASVRAVQARRTHAAIADAGAASRTFARAVTLIRRADRALRLTSL